jgi:hypothetical protein
MNAVEIEEAIAGLAAQPFDSAEFPFLFLAAFGNKETTLKRLRKGDSNASDIPNGVLQRNNIHIAVCGPGEVAGILMALRESPKTAQAKVKFILSTDGTTLEAEDLNSGESIACDYPEFPDHFGFFLPLAGISTIREIKDNPIDVRATGRLNKLYVELLRENPDWAKEDRRPEMNHFMARLVFCFFAEDTDIFTGTGLFTGTVDRMSERDGSNTHKVLETIFRAMNIKHEERVIAELPRWAAEFPYVNGGLFEGEPEVPRFTRTARAYLYQAGQLNWKEINPDIFGSMIQAVADDEERGALGLHYTSVPNILRVLNPLFLDDLRMQLQAAGDNKIKLLNLRKRMSRIRVFDPACGSGNFLVIAYKHMRAIEAEINRHRGESQQRTEIPLTNFRGIEVRDFPAEIARLALIIAEFQSDVLYRGQKEALAEVLPLDAMNWITCGNALQLDWLSICPPTGSGVKFAADDLFHAPLDQAQIDFENEGGETFICGNPPYKGSQWQSEEQKGDLKAVFDRRTTTWKSLDYVAGWFMKAADYANRTASVAAFVSTNSICQGRQVETLWPLIFSAGQEIVFAHTSFTWTNLASYNAGVTVVIVGLSNHTGRARRLFSMADNGSAIVKETETINAYLVPGPNVIVRKESRPTSALAEMSFGNMPNDGGHLLLAPAEAAVAINTHGVDSRFLRRFVGSQEFIQGVERRCIWVTSEEYAMANANEWLAARFKLVHKHRSESQRATTIELAKLPFRFGEVRQVGNESIIAVAAISSENRDYLPCGLLPPGTIVSNKCFAFYDAPLWNMALVASRLHWVWIATVCVRLRTDFSYSNTLGWNTFPVPVLTEQNKVDLTHSAEDILLAREAHFPATIADLYDSRTMPENLRRAHERNDEVLERVYVGRRFRNDTERLEKLFELYSKMEAKKSIAREEKKTK